MLRGALIMLSLGCATTGAATRVQPKPPAPQGLEGIWLLKSPTNQASKARPEGYGSLRFDAGKNQVQGFDGCNSFQAGYTEDAQGKLTFSPFATSLKLCSYPAHGPSWQAVAQATGYVRQGDALTLLDAQGKALAVFTVQGPKQPAKP